MLDKVLGYLLTVLAESYKFLADIPEKNLPRMADFMYHGEAIARGNGPRTRLVFPGIFREHFAAV